MYKCIYCGFESLSETARFCSQCGPECPANSWREEDVDQKSKVSQYASLLSEYFFESHSDVEVEKVSLRMRERLKISHAKHVAVLSKLSEQKKAIEHLSNFRFEFNENVTDAYAGHDTFLDFRYTNLSQEDAFKVSLLWDDPETTGRVDLRAEAKSFVKPLASLTIGGSAVFDRIGIKEISDLQITITDQFGDSADFRAEPFRFKVANHEQRITNNISTHNQISIEGRGVVDATGMGADKGYVQHSVNNQPSWKQLRFSYMPRADAQTLSEDLTAIVASAADPKKVSSEVFGVPRELIGSNLIGVQTPALGSSIKHDIEIRVPDIGDFSDVQVIELLVKVGDKINAEQSLITVESDKACLEIPSLHSGILKDLKVKLGDKVSEGALIATIETVDIVEVSESQLQQSNSSNAPDVLEVRIPDIGDIKDVVVIEVLVKVGDIVQKEQSLITIESDKCTMEIPSSQSGVVKEVKVRLGDKVNQGLLVLLLEAPVSTKSSLANEAQCPAVKVFIPSTRQLSRLTLVTEILELMDGVRSRSKHWHILVGGSKSVPKLIIRDLLLQNQDVTSVRTTSGSYLKNARDLAAILTGLEEDALFELEELEELFLSGNTAGDIIYSALADFQLDLVIGEGVDARPIKLDLQPFCSIHYCKDINTLPVAFLKIFNCCLTVED